MRWSNRPTQPMIIDWNTEGVRGVRYVESCAMSDTVCRWCYEVSIVRRCSPMANAVKARWFCTMSRMLHEGLNDVEGLILCRRSDTMSKVWYDVEILIRCRNTKSESKGEVNLRCYLLSQKLYTKCVKIDVCRTNKRRSYGAMGILDASTMYQCANITCECCIA